MSSGNCLDQRKNLRVMALLYLPLQILLTQTWHNYDDKKKTAQEVQEEIDEKKGGSGILNMALFFSEIFHFAMLCLSSHLQGGWTKVTHSRASLCVFPRSRRYSKIKLQHYHLREQCVGNQGENLPPPPLSKFMCYDNYLHKLMTAVFS